MAECLFDESGVFHFKIEFYEDEMFTTLKFEDRSDNNPDHFFVGGNQVTASGTTIEAGICYTIEYKPEQQFLADNGLLDEVLFIKTRVILKETTKVS